MLQKEQLQAKFEELCKEQEKLINPEFETIFNALYEVDEGQRAIYNTDGWNMGQDLPDKADEEKIKKAFTKANIKSNRLYKGFVRYANIVIEGKRLQVEMALQTAKELTPPQPPVVAGWIFKPMGNIIAPMELHSTINKVIYNESLNGLFDCSTDTDKGIDLLLDDLLMAEAFGVRCSLMHYVNTLKQYKIVLGSNSFFDKTFTYILLYYLQQAVLCLKEYANQPNHLKKAIADIVAIFDQVPVWGIFFQMLILQGLCDMLERLDINEGDTGLDEAQFFYNWLVDVLLEKEYHFTCVSSMSYSDEDFKRLEPLCSYLVSTRVGQIVQNYITGKRQEPQPTEAETPTAAAKPQQVKRFNCGKSEQTLKNILDRLIKGGYIANDTTLPQWLYWWGKSYPSNATYPPINWLKTQSELGCLIQELAGSQLAPVAQAFVIKGKRPNISTIRAERTAIRNKTKTTPKTHSTLLKIIKSEVVKTK